MFDITKMKNIKSNHNLRTIKWKQCIREKARIAIPETFLKGISKAEQAKKDGSYHSVLGRYTMGWMYGILTSDEDIRPSLNTEEQRKWAFVTADELPENWWRLAMRTGKNGAISEDMPGRGDGVIDADEEDKKAELYDSLMPAYRAFRESFQARPWYHWFTQHDRYTAERDTMNAIRGIMMTLTGCNRAAFDSDYNQYIEYVTEQVKVDEPKKVEGVKEKVHIDKNAISNDKNLDIEKPIDIENKQDKSIVIDDMHEAL